jgi:hypothetical protein
MNTPHFRGKSKPRTPTYKNSTTKHLPTTNIPKDKNTAPNTTQKQNWATFTYTVRERRTVTRLLKNTNIHIMYRTKKHVTKPPATKESHHRHIQ